MIKKLMFFFVVCLYLCFQGCFAAEEGNKRIESSSIVNSQIPAPIETKSSSAELVVESAATVLEDETVISAPPHAKKVNLDIKATAAEENEGQTTSVTLIVNRLTSSNTEQPVEGGTSHSENIGVQQTNIPSFMTDGVIGPGPDEIPTTDSIKSGLTSPETIQPSRFSSEIVQSIGKDEITTTNSEQSGHSGMLSQETKSVELASSPVKNKESEGKETVMQTAPDTPTILDPQTSETPQVLDVLSTASQVVSSGESESTTTESPAATASATIGEQVEMKDGEKGEIKEEDGEKVPDSQEEFPSFAEWTQKVLAEQEKTKQEKQLNGQPTQALTKQKLRINHASKNCGAKILAMNAEAENVQGVLTGNKDEYMINPCTAKKWFSMELCEPIQLKAVEIASLELFSSQPKSFRVLVSDRYPAKEWRLIGQFEALQDKVAQGFQVNDEHFVKFVKVELQEHYGNEHYCPITLFRVFGVPMMDDDDDVHDAHNEPASTELDAGVVPEGEEDESQGDTKNLFTSAKDTVVNLVKKVLNVEDKPKEAGDAKPEENGDLKFKKIEGNFSKDGHLLPCVPEASDGSQDKTSTKSPTISTPTVYVPEATVEVKTETPLVTKLEDDEQMPSEQFENPSLVTFLDADVTEAVSGCQNISKSNGTCPHKVLCSYVQTMLGNLIMKTCSRVDSVASTTGIVTETVNIDITSEKTSMPGISTTHMSKSFKSSLSESVRSIMDSLLESISKKVSVSSSTSTLETSSIESSVSVRTEESTDIKMASEKVNSTSELAEPSVEKSKDTSLEASLLVSLQSSSTVPTEERSKVVNSKLESPDSEDVLAEKESKESIPLFEKEDQTPLNVPSLESSSSSPLQTDSSGSVPTPVLDIQESQNMDQKLEPNVEGTLVSKVIPSPTTSSQDSAEANALPQTVAPSVKSEVSQAVPSNVQDSKPDKVTASSEVPTEDSVIKAQNATTKEEGEKKRKLNLVKIPVASIAKRETAIMRLTNRIKALELNVSLSSRFLDELSQRFKRQSEEMMKVLNKTIARSTEATRNAEIRDQKQQEQLDSLETRVENLTIMMFQISQSMDDLTTKIIDRQMVWTSIECLLLLIVCVICLRRRKSPPVHPDLQYLLDMMPKHPPKSLDLRRNSDVGTIGHMAPMTPMRKQASESALTSPSSHKFDNIESKDLLLSEQQPPKEGNKRKKKRKHKNLESKSSVDIIQHCDSGLDLHSPTQLNSSAGLLFGADACDALTGSMDMPDSTNSSYRSSTTSLPCHSRNGSQCDQLKSFAEIQTDKPSVCPATQKPPPHPPPAVPNVKGKKQSQSVLTLTNGTSLLGKADLKQPGRQTKSILKPYDIGSQLLSQKCESDKRAKDICQKPSWRKSLGFR